MSNALTITLALLCILLTSCNKVKDIPELDSVALAKTFGRSVVLMADGVPVLSNVGGIMYSPNPKLVAGWINATPKRNEYFIVQFGSEKPTVLYFDTLEGLNRHLARMGLSSLDMRHEVNYEDIDQRLYRRNPRLQQLSAPHYIQNN
jgi:hypothetical protein